MGEQEGAKVVGALHHLEALLCAVVLHQEDTCVVHEYVQLLVSLEDLLAEGLDGPADTMNINALSQTANSEKWTCRHIEYQCPVADTWLCSSGQDT